MIKVCICGSFRFFERMVDLHNQISAMGIDCHRPNPFRYRQMSNPRRFTDEWESLSTQSQIEVTRRAELEYLKKIDDSQIVYVVNHGGYVGVSVLLEIGYAFAKNKEIYLQEEANDLAIASLISDVIPTSEFLELLQAKCI